MKLRPVIKKELQSKIKTTDEVKEVPKKDTKNTKKKGNTLPPDEYKPMFEPIRILVKDMPSQKDPTKRVKQYLELSVKRFNDDEALPNVWVQMYQESEFYTGYLKGKTIYLPLEMLYDFIDSLNVLSEECDKRHIE